MELTFKINKADHQPYIELKDVKDMGLEPSEYITNEQLASEFRLSKDAVVKFLEVKKIRPFAKILNRDKSGKVTDGRPQIAFSPSEAKSALIAGIEKRYGG